MENQFNEALVKKLLDEDAAFRKSYKTHKDYETKLARFEKKPHLTPVETIEVNRLKKLKLALKDEMLKRLQGTRN